MIGVLVAVLLAMQTPARDVPVPSRSGSGSISGTVVTDDADARPLRRVQVQLESGTLELPREVVTDDTGRFVFDGLPPANYTLQAVRPTYVTAYYGSKKPGRGPGVPIAVVEKQRVSGITLKMLKGAVITGVVRLPGGKPVASLTVQARRVSTVGGERQYEYGKSGSTDDRGEYRIFGLAPGNYVVQVSPPASGGSDMRRITPAEINAAEALLKAGATTPTPPPVPDPGPSLRFANVYFPSATDPSRAQTITVAAGQELAGVDMAIEFVPTAQITGVVIGPNARLPTNLRVTLLPKRAETMASYAGQPPSVVPRPDGSFSAAGIAPGRYVLRARAEPATDAPPATLWASEEIDVNGRDISGLVLRLQPGMSVTGKLVFDSATLPLPDPARVRLSLPVVSAPGASAQDASILSIMSGGHAVTVEKDGTFAIRGAAPGMYRLSATPPGLTGGQVVPGVRSWVVTSITVNGRDLADLPIEIKAGEDVSDVVIVLSDRLTEIAGTVFDQLGRPTPGFPIVVFATNRDYWPAGEARVRRVQPASDGKYAVAGLPPGEYYVCAVTDVDPADLKDPAFLESLTSASIKITLTAGEKKPLDLKLGGG